MSTVLRPVGPLPARVYWIRRAILIGIVLIIVLIFATQCGGGGGAAGKKTGSGSPTKTTSTTPKPTVGACTPSELKVTVSTDTPAYTSGQAPTLIATLSNPTATTCRLARSVDNEIWTIRSSTSTVVWSTQGCSADPVAASTKIVGGATKQIETMWDGHSRGSSCQDGDAAPPGLYHLTATIDGIKAHKPATFHIIE